MQKTLRSRLVRPMDPSVVSPPRSCKKSLLHAAIARSCGWTPPMRGVPRRSRTATTWRADRPASPSGGRGASGQRGGSGTQDGRSSGCPQPRPGPTPDRAAAGPFRLQNVPVALAPSADARRSATSGMPASASVPGLGMPLASRPPPESRVLVVPWGAAHPIVPRRRPFMRVARPCARAEMRVGNGCSAQGWAPPVALVHKGDAARDDGGPRGAWSRAGCAAPALRACTCGGDHWEFLVREADLVADD